MARTLGNALCLWLATVAVGASAADWPQILGPDRDAVAHESLPDTLPAQLPLQWTLPIGQGYAGPAVVGSRVVLFHRDRSDPSGNDVDIVQAVRLSDGGHLWKTSFPAIYRGGIDPDVGPRCVPIVTGDRVIVFSAAGDLHCLELASGKKQWSRHLYADYRAQEGYFGAGSTPIVVDNQILVNVGGQRDAGIVAVALETGKTLWQATREGASYSSPVQVRDGKSPPKYVLFITRLNALMVDPNNGAVLTRAPFGRRGPTVNAATPIHVGKGRYFLTASYGVGGMLLDLSVKGGPIVWQNEDSIASQYNTPVFHDGFLYGIHGREDLGAAELRCIRAETGQLAWREPDFGVAHLIRLGNRVLALRVDGSLVCFAADPMAFRKLGSWQPTQQICRALPAFSQQRFIFRTNQGGSGGSVLCIDFSPTTR